MLFFMQVAGERDGIFFLTNYLLFSHERKKVLPKVLSDHDMAELLWTCVMESVGLPNPRSGWLQCFIGAKTPPSPPIFISPLMKVALAVL